MSKLLRLLTGHLLRLFPVEYAVHDLEAHSASNHYTNFVLYSQVSQQVTVEFQMLDYNAEGKNIHI